MTNTPETRTANMVHFPSKDASDPNALDEYLDTIRTDVDTNTTDIATNTSDLTTIKGGLQELWLPASVWANGSGSTYSTEATTGLPVWTMSPSVNEFIRYSWAPPKRWARGTVTFQVYWSLDSAGTNDVVWNLELGSYSDGDSIGNTFGSASVIDSGTGADGDLQITSVSGAITVAGSPADGDLVKVTMVRAGTSGSDTATVDAHFIGMKLFWTADAGSDD